MKLNGVQVLLIIHGLLIMIGATYGKITEFERCDNGTPDSINDCTQYDTEFSSCCYFKYGSVKGCVMLGKRYLGEIVYGGMDFICEGIILRRKQLAIALLSFGIALI